MNKAAVGVVAVIVVAAAIGGGLYLKQNIDGIVKDLIETVGTETTGTSVKLAGVKLDLTEGAGVISGMTVANPEGFSTNSLFSVNSINIAIEPESFTSEVYIIDDIAIDGAKVLAEQVGGGTNIQALLNNMDTAEEPVGGDATGTSEEPRLGVRRINFTNGNLHLKSDIFGERTLSMPDFTVSDIGTSGKGLTPDELGTEIAKELLVQVKDAVKDEISDLASDAAKAKLKEQIGEKATEGLNKLKGLFNKDD